MLNFLILFLLRAYQRWFSPWLPVCCRFYPSCSDYSIAAVQQYGAIKGFWLALKRLLRCHPFCEGGIDPLPHPPGKKQSSR